MRRESGIEVDEVQRSGGRGCAGSEVVLIMHISIPSERQLINHGHTKQILPLSVPHARSAPSLVADMQRACGDAGYDSGNGCTQCDVLP